MPLARFNLSPFNIGLPPPALPTPPPVIRRDHVPRRLCEWNYFIFKGRKSSDYDIVVQSLPDITIPERRVSAFTVDGRSGSLIVDDGTFNHYTKSVLGLALSPKYWDSITAWLTGSGDVIFSNEKSKRYSAMVKNSVSFARVFKSNEYREFLVQFDVQPYKSDVTAPASLVLTGTGGQIERGTVINPGTAASYPIMKITGTGTTEVAVNGRDFKVRDLPGSIIIDSRAVMAYGEGGGLMNRHMLGEYPYFDPGENMVAWTSNVRKIEIIPYWGWI